MVSRNAWIWLLYGSATLSIIAALYFALWSSEQASLDFQWDASRVLLNRTNPYALALLGQDPHLLPDSFAPNQFPSALILLWGYAALPWTVAKGLWAVSNLVFSVSVVLLLRRLYAPTLAYSHTFLIGALWIGGYAWRLHIGLGQHTLFSLCFFLLSLLALQQKRVGWAGVWLAVALFKYSTILPLYLTFVQRRAWKPIAIAGGIHVMLHLFAAWWVGESPVTLVLQPFLVSQNLTTQGSLDLFALLHTTGILARLGAAQYATIIAAGIAILLLGAAAVAGWKGKPQTPNLELTYLVLVTVLSNILVYHRLYDFVTLIIPLFWVMTRYHTLPKVLVGVVIGAFVLLNYLHPIIEWASTTILIAPLFFTSHLYLLVALYYAAILLLFREWHQTSMVISRSHQ